MKKIDDGGRGGEMTGAGTGIAFEGVVSDILRSEERM